MQAYQWWSRNTLPFAVSGEGTRFYGVGGVPAAGSGPAYTFPATDIGMFIAYNIVAITQDKTIKGTVGEALSGLDTVDITLYGTQYSDIFPLLDASEWLVNLPAGLSVSVEMVDSMTVRLTFAGTPDVDVTEDAIIIIPIDLPLGVFGLVAPIGGTIAFDIAPASGGGGGTTPGTGDSGIVAGALMLLVLSTGFQFILVRTRRVGKQA